MPIFIKNEKFTKAAKALSSETRKEYLNQHRSWVQSLKHSGRNIASGYLVSKKKKPGGGGLLVIEANTFEEAKIIIEKDPMIKNNLVTWEIQEWIPVSGVLLERN